MKNKAWTDEIEREKISCLSGNFIWPMRKSNNSFRFYGNTRMRIYQTMS